MQQGHDLIRVALGIVLAIAVVILAGVILVIVMLAAPGCSLADGGFLSDWFSKGKIPIEQGDDSNVFVLQAAGGSTGLILWSLFLWWRGRLTPVKAVKRLVTAYNMVASEAEKQAVRKMVCSHHPPYDSVPSITTSCTCDPAEHLINKCVKAGKK